jgi:hypothetical protein
MSNGDILANLEPTQEQAIIALLNEPTVRKAAAAVGLNEKTIHRWLEEPAFSTAYRKARRQAFNQAISICHRFTPVALQTLAKILVNEKASDSSRVSAANAILKYGRDSIELDDLAERIGTLEAQLTGKVTVSAPGSDSAGEEP